MRLHTLEKKRTSITRLKLNIIRQFRPRFVGVLKRKEPRLRDWNCDTCGWRVRFKLFAWKEKNLDYEIETMRPKASTSWTSWDSWKEKNLDYEIETCFRHGGQNTRVSTWKEKNLDYEIETYIRYSSQNADTLKLEKKRTSITRLKPSRQGRPSRDCRSTWKEKNLDYEIETTRHWVASTIRLPLKRKEPRLRDWNNDGISRFFGRLSDLKRDCGCTYTSLTNNL